MTLTRKRRPPFSPEEFDQKLAEILDMRSASILLMVPGIYEILSEELNDEVLACEASRRRDQALARGEVLPFYVVCYAIDRRYGGPEEGGWYQDWLSILEVRKAWDLRDGLRMARELKRIHPTCRYGRGSVLGRGDVYVRTYHGPEEFPTETTERMRYE